MKPYKQFKSFQVRWKEVLKQGDTPYLYRWTVLFFGYSMRIHHWVGNDVNPHFHDHSADFISFLVKGSYTNHTPNGSVHKTAPAFTYAKAEWRHWLEVGPKGAWTITFWGKPYRKWGFWVNNHLWRPLRYFSKFGVKS
jgi:hypothetical protein